MGGWRWFDPPPSPPSSPLPCSTQENHVAHPTTTPLSAATSCFHPLTENTALPSASSFATLPTSQPKWLAATGETLAGAIGGSAGIMVGHPFDTIKVRMQRGDFRSSWHCLKEAIHQEGRVGLLRGLVAPVIGNVPLNSIIFGVYGTSCTYLATRFPFEDEKKSTRRLNRLSDEIGESTPGNLNDVNLAGQQARDDEAACNERVDIVDDEMPFDEKTRSSKELRMRQPLWQIAIAGTATGVAAVPVQSITDIVKIRMQLSVRSMVHHNQPSYHHPKEFPTSTYECLRSIVREGGPIGLTRGFTATALRDSWSHGVSFAIYEGICRKWVTQEGQTHPIALMAAGGCASAISWGMCYPLDVIKSSIQAENMNNQKWWGSTWRTAKQLHKEHGWRAFTRGIAPSLLRALPVGATTFGVYEAFLIGWQKSCDKFLNPSISSPIIPLEPPLPSRTLTEDPTHRSGEIGDETLQNVVTITPAPPEFIAALTHIDVSNLSADGVHKK